MKEFKVLNIKNQTLMDFLVILALFIPLPISEAGKYTPDYVIGDWGLTYTIKLGKHISLGHIMILVALIF
jgi:hypothetical protein